MNKTLKSLLLGILAVINFVCVYPCIWAAGPSAISYQGRLRESGQPVSGTRSFNFKLFTAPSAGTEVWASGAVPVLVSSGIYSTQIGNDNLKSLNFAANDYYLEISVGGNAFSPRERISAVPYAFNASTATNVMGAGHIRMSGAAGNHWILNGNIGVGTSSPSSRLELRGPQQNGDLGLANAVRISDFEALDGVNGYETGLGIRAYKAASAVDWGYSTVRLVSTIRTNIYSIDHWYNNLGWIDFASNPYLNDIVFGSGAAENMRIRNTGTVGIGVVSPSATLHVSSTTSANLLVVSSGVLSGQEVFTVTKTGKVGIGTAAPGSSLTVIGSVDFSKANTTYYASNPAEPSLGTPHYFNSNYPDWKYSNGSVPAQTFVTLTFSEVPDGTKAIVVVVGTNNGASTAYWRPTGSGLGYALARRLTPEGPSLVILNAAKQCDFAVYVGGGMHISYPIFYYQ